MTRNKEISPSDLAVVVWPRRSVLAGRDSAKDAASGNWAMDAEKADRASVLISVYENRIIGAWRIVGTKNRSEVPTGKTRQINRTEFLTVEDARLGYLTGMASPLEARRNPQATMPLRDLPGWEGLVESQPATDGVVQLGGFALTVRPDGSADLLTPVGAAVTVRSA
jgi:hypothetical protein